MDRKLSKYIIPSIISMVLVGTYTNIDGFFIGNVAGDDGLAAINIVWPIVALITSIGTGLGIGGSVLLSKAKGIGDGSEDEVRSTLLMLLPVVGILSGMLLTPLSGPLLILMGAEGKVLDYALTYAYIVSGGAVFQILGSGLVALLRNEGKTYYSMICCIVGLVVHLALDWLLVEKYTLAGVALSTVISQAVISVMCIAVTGFGKRSYIKRSQVLPILKCSTSPLGINFIPSIVLLLTNYFALSEGGTAAVSAYAVMSYAVYTFDYVFQGVCDGVQPVISYCYGSKDKVGEARALKTGGITVTVFFVIFMALTPALIALMPKLFAVSETANEMMKTGFIIYAFSYPFKAAVKYIGSYFYACEETRLSNILIYADPLLLTPITLLLFSALFGMVGVWLSLTVSQLLLTILGAILLIVNKKVKIR